MENAKSGYARAVVINSGNANACVGEQGYKNAVDISEFTSKLLLCESSEFSSVQPVLSVNLLICRLYVRELDRLMLLFPKMADMMRKRLL